MIMYRLMHDPRVRLAVVLLLMGMFMLGCKPDPDDVQPHHWF